jgi:hypothetical protein
MINLDIALGQEFFRVTIGKSVTEIPSNDNMITSGGNRKPSNADNLGIGRRNGDDSSFKQP